MPAYNAAPFIAEAIESIVSQTYPHWELVIINDGSSDDTASVITRFSDKRIRYIEHVENKGIKARRDEALHAANGDIVCWMDADDISYPKRLALQVKAFADDADLAICSGVSDNLVNGRIERGSHIELMDSKLKAAMFFGFPFKNATIAMRREAALKAIEREHEVKQAEDYVLYTNMMKLGKFHQLASPLIQYRIHQSDTRITDDRNNADIVAGRMVAWRKMLAFFKLSAGDELLVVHDKMTYYADRITTVDANSFVAYLHLLAQMLDANKRLGIFHQRYFHQQVAARLYITLLHPMCKPAIGYKWFLRNGHLLRLTDWIKFPVYKLRPIPK